jgi:hypothetical protein
MPDFFNNLRMLYIFELSICICRFNFCDFKTLFYNCFYIHIFCLFYSGCLSFILYLFPILKSDYESWFLCFYVLPEFALQRILISIGESKKYLSQHDSKNLGKITDNIYYSLAMSVYLYPIFHPFSTY